MSPNSFLLKLSTLALLTTCTIASPTTAEVQFDEVIPGPGLPTLASLGLTSADLHKPIPRATLATLTEVDPFMRKRWNNECQTWGLTSYINAVACYNYLNSLGSQDCGVDTNIIFCAVGSTYIGGSNVGGIPHTSSACVDVATGALWILNNCNIAGALVQGDAAAYGNGNLVVSIEAY
ncbi:hypothetical protein GALMADRAFT_71211 [Galerina marginata CBS 339.88]|uniref:Cyanovirin-N domain-containing protein n=1 Tax=Galerina marginata (strain CBS 339.88) TaxID=685588 RepID=A0A067SSE7_GALM3|nr:hypothetical protein GALMADRAFT_71211 [Galerina marginata CBS 339.88]